jgi:hypothetical protein
MKTSVVSPFVVALLALFLASVSPVSAQTAAPAKVKKIPFHGTLKSVDTSANTVTLDSKKDAGGRVFYVLSTTKITDGAGNATTLSTAVVGEDVGGSYTTDASGHMNLNSVRLGAKAGSTPKTPKTAVAATPPSVPAKTPSGTPAPAATPAPAPATPPASAAPATKTAVADSGKKQKFSGKVVSVDTASNTLVVHGKADQTFTVTSTTKITGAANLGAIAAGAKVTGTYSKSADGATLTVATLKVTP